MKHALKLLIIVVSVFLMGYFLEKAIDITATNVKDPLENYLEISVELLSVFVSFSIFTMTWHAYGKSRDNHSLFLGGAFFVIGLLILFHTFSYPFMPDFITPNSFHKVVFFLIESRLVLALSLLASVYIYKDTLPALINKRVLLSSVIFLSAISLAFVLLYPRTLFEPDDTNNGYSTAAIFLLSINTVIVLCAYYLYARRLKETGQKNLIFLIYGSITLVSSNFVYLSYEFSGHLLIVTGFYFIYLALYKSSIELPYEKLAIAEEKLRRASEKEKDRLLKAINSSSEGIVITNETDRYIYINEAYAKIFGYTQEELIGETWRKLLPAGLIAPTEKELTRTLHNKEVGMFGAEHPGARKDGTTIPIEVRGTSLWDENGSYQGHICIVRDITARKQVEEKLLLFRKLIEQSNDAIFVNDPETARILDANERACVNLGYKREELLNMRVLDFEVNLPDQFSWKEHVKDVQNRGHTLFEGRHRRKNGTTFPVEVNVSFIALGKISYMVAVVRDITERKQAEEQIMQSLKEKEILLREIHHRVKNNMAIVSSLLEHQSHYIKDKNVIDMFTESQNRILTMSLVHEKLYQSRDLAKIDFNEYISDMVADLIHSYEVNGSKITLNLNIENIPLDIDFAIPCGLIINELVTNSLKYAFPSGTQGEIKIAFRSTDENMLELVVSDNGIGIPEDLDFRKTGSLGLHLITTLAENQLYGEINLNRSKGTEFKIKFRGIK